MQLKSLTVGNLQIRNNVFMAPLAGYTDYAFRSLVLELGAGLTFTELVSAKGINFGGGANKELLKCNDYNLTSAQLFGADPYFMRKACESKELALFKFVDINMGCPVPKVYKNGEGSALLTDLKKAENIIKECVKSGKIITVKIRTGLKEGDDIAKEVSIMAESAGASLITIHGRVREKYYSGEPDYKAIENAKKSVKIPIIANGGIFTVSDANLMIEKTGADGVMLARGGIENPFLFCELLGTKSPYNKKQFILKHLDGMKELYGDRKANVEFRKFASYYFKGKDGSKELRTQIMTLQSVEEIKELIDKKL